MQITILIQELIRWSVNALRNIWHERGSISLIRDTRRWKYMYHVSHSIAELSRICFLTQSESIKSCNFTLNISNPNAKCSNTINAISAQELMCCR